MRLCHRSIPWRRAHRAGCRLLAVLLGLIVLMDAAQAQVSGGRGKAGGGSVLVNLKTPGTGFFVQTGVQVDFSADPMKQPGRFWDGQSLVERPAQGRARLTATWKEIPSYLPWRNISLNAGINPLKGSSQVGTRLAYSWSYRGVKATLADSYSVTHWGLLGDVLPGRSWNIDRTVRIELPSTKTALIFGRRTWSGRPEWLETLGVEQELFKLLKLRATVSDLLGNGQHNAGVYANFSIRW